MSVPIRAFSILLCFGLAWGWPPAAGAAEPAAAADAADAPPAEQAPELLLWQDIPTVISASRREEPVTRAPNAVSIITADQIHGSGMMTLGDLLRLAVGVDVGRITDHTFGIGVRGLHGQWANNTLVLMDGRTIYDPVFGGVVWGMHPIFIEDIERIEVVRGPGGAAWGANAANGVINIITRKPGDTPGGFLSQTLTDRLDSLTHLRYGLTAGKLDARLSLGYDSMPEFDVGNTGGNHDFSRASRGHLRTTYHIDETRSLDIDAGFLENIHGRPPEVGQNLQLRWGRERERSAFLRTRYTEQNAPDDLWYVQYVLNTAKRAELGGFWTEPVQHDLEVQRVRPLGDSHLLTYGGNVRQDIIRAGGESDTTVFLTDHSRNFWAGLFIQDNWKVHEHWTLIGGGRMDHNSYTGWEWSGRGTALYHPVPEHVFRASVARAHRAPTLFTRHTRLRVGPTGLPAPLPPYAVIINSSKDLNSAYVNAYEFGYTHEKRSVRLNAEFFWNQYRGMVGAADATGVFPVTMRFANEVDGELYGVELSGEWKVTKRLRLSAAYVWEQWIQEGSLSDEGSIEATGIVRPPQNKVTVGAKYEPADGLTLHGNMFWVDKVYDANADPTPAYARFDFGVTKKLGKNCELGAGVLNAFDPSHPEVSTNAAAPLEVGPRTWYIRFQANY